MIKYSSHKFNNRKTLVHGIAFDSQDEANRYLELKLLERAGAITDLQLQVKYLLIPAKYESFARYGKRGQRLKDGVRCIEKECAYFADFVYTDTKTGEQIVEDVKGYRTEDYIIKRKLMLHLYDIRIREVKM